MDVGPEALDLLTVTEVAERFRVSPATVWRLVYAELKLPGTGIESVKMGHIRRIPVEAAAAYRKRLLEAAKPAGSTAAA